MVLEIWSKEVASVALDKSMVGISDATVQFKVFLVVDLEDEELEPQAASIKQIMLPLLQLLKIWKLSLCFLLTCLY